MKRTHILAHFSFPALLALVGLLMSLRREPLNTELLLGHLGLGLLFYPAPHLVWAAIAATAKPALWAWHAGFAVSSGALLLIAAVSVWGPRDPSDLPHQWVVYWPFAGLLLAAVVVSWLLAGRPLAGTPSGSCKQASDGAA